jgi:uncharacterized membrane protein YedE/YeeE
MKGTAMPGVALVLFAVFGALGFGWRSWEQRRCTGSTGFRGVSGRLGSAEWFAGVGFVVALVAAVAAPALQLARVVSPLSRQRRPLRAGCRSEPLAQPYAARANVGQMARKQMNSKQEASWLWVPLIIGLIIGVTVAGMTGQWWWSTVGVLVGAAVGAAGAGKLRWPGSS